MSSPVYTRPVLPTSSTLRFGISLSSVHSIGWLFSSCSRSLLAVTAFSLGTSAAEILPPGFRPQSPGVIALVGGNVVVKPGETITNATVVIRNGLFEAVGKDAEIPVEARVWKLDGATVYPGFIDPALTLKPTSAAGGPQQEDDDLAAGGIHFFGISGQEKDPGKPGPGNSLSDVTPEYRIAESYSIDLKSLQALRELGFSAGNIVPEKGIFRGTSAFVLLGDEGPNKSILKADVFQNIAFQSNNERHDAYPKSLMGVIAAIRQTFLDARYHLEVQHSNAPTNYSVESMPMDLSLAALLPVTEKKMPVLFYPGSALMVARAGKLAEEFDIPFLIMASGDEWRRPDLANAKSRGFIVPVHFPEIPKFPEEDDWTALSLDQLRAWDWAPENAAVLRNQKQDVAFTLYGLSDRKSFRKNLRLAIDRGLSEADAIAALTTIPAKYCGLENQMGTIEPGKIANLTVVEGSYFVATNKVREVWVHGRAYRVQPSSTAQQPDKSLEKAAPQEAKEAKEEEKRDQKKQEEKREIVADRVAKSPQEGRGPLQEPSVLLVKNATIWTSGPDGIITNASMLMVDGKITEIGTDVKAPSTAKTIDAEGKHVSPGLIDCHSHAMVLGSVNEGTVPSSAMVRISDVVNSETRNIMDQLAGGLTIANLLHGSANPIGGQNCVIKLKDGAAPDDLIIKDAPGGIKFALGENVKQSNWGERNVTRFPQSRMGVPSFMINRFTAAKRYQAELEDWEKSRLGNDKSKAKPVRRDLELDAIVEILKGERLIHCHSYRQDEIIAFLRVMERFNVKVGTLQHILEGYKVADEIAKHGAGASCFTDWWGYKFEVLDAIPYAGALMHERGVLVSFNSDSAELARRMNTEAAKAVKYGGVPEDEALKFVTINSA
ncbi:MAG: amidohydrolase family protein, partial [Verrucomicrobiales bacterium]